MRKLLGCFLCVMLLVFGVSVSTLAYPIPFDTGTYLGKYSGPGVQDDAASVAAFLGILQSELDFIEKVESGQGSTINIWADNMGTQPVTWGEMSGYWESTDPEVWVAYITIKGANDIGVWEYDPSAHEGGWTTENLINNGGQQPAISHVSFWGGPSSVPEPATMFLLGTGLIGLALFGRQRFKK